MGCGASMHAALHGPESIPPRYEADAPSPAVQPAPSPTPSPPVADGADFSGLVKLFGLTLSKGDGEMVDTALGFAAIKVVGLLFTATW